MAEKNIKIVLLSDHYEDGQKIPCGTVASVPESVAKALVEEGKADDNAKAVAYYAKQIQAVEPGDTED